MNRLLGVSLFCLLFCSTAAADLPNATGGEGTSVAEQLKNNPDDPKAFNAWMTETAKSISELTETAPDEAQKVIMNAHKLLAELKPASAEGKALLLRGRSMLANYEEMLALSRVSLADVEKELDAKPSDLKVIQKYSRKVSVEVGPIARTEPDKAEAVLKLAKDRVAKLKVGAAEKPIKSQLDMLERTIASLERNVEHGHELQALIGQQATPLAIESWVNGSPLAAEDLKGKVVLLDFWSVWCGPCIATFPHLREWQNQYADKGLVIVGLTRYYDYIWDDAAGRPMRAKNKEDVPPDVEHEMLKRFAKLHNLQHRFAIQTDASSVAGAFAVKGIPHVVVIDRQGIIRMVRVGSGSKNAKAIHDMIVKLLAEPTTVTK